MADFSANLISVPGVTSTSAAGGSAAAAIVTFPSLLKGDIYAGQYDAVFETAGPTLFDAYISGGWVAASVLAPDSVSEARVTNRVYDSVAGKNITWVTNGHDRNGVYYPGPGVYGISTSNYVEIARK